MNSRESYAIPSFTFPQKGSNISLWVIDFGLKIAQRGKRKLVCLSGNYICALLPFFSVLVLWHKEKSASLARGKHVEAALSIFSMIPLAGDMAGAVKVGKNFKKISDLPKKLEQNIYKKTTTGASKKQLTSEQINELQQREIQKLEFEASKRCLGNTCFPGGTIVHTKNGQIPIDQITIEFYKTPVEVYNFEVDNWHTYMIGELGILVHNGKKTCSGKIPKPSEEETLFLDLLGYYDAKKVITDIGRGEVDLDTLKAGASLIPVAKITKVPKVVKAIGNVGKTGSKKGKEGDKTVWKRFTQEDKPKPDKNKGNQSKTGSKGSTTTSKPNQEETSKSGQVKQTKARDKGGSKSKVGDFTNLEGSTVDDILDRIPDDATMRELHPVKGGASEGFEFKWVQNGQTYRVRVHSADAGAPAGSNAANGWIVRVQRGRQYYDSTINDFQPAKYTNPKGDFFDENVMNNTHIPIKDPYK